MKNNVSNNLPLLPIANRIVSISQPHIRQIVRGKAKAYKSHYAFWPESIHADKAYTNRVKRGTSD